jgi:hypothetical protein
MGDDFFDSDDAVAAAAVADAVAGRSSSVVGDDFFSDGCDDAIFAAIALLLLGWSVQSKAKESADSRIGTKPKFCGRMGARRVPYILYGAYRSLSAYPEKWSITNALSNAQKDHAALRGGPMERPEVYFGDPVSH